MCGDRWVEELDSPVPRNYRDAYERACVLMRGRDPRIDAETAGVAYTDLGNGQGRFLIPLLTKQFEVDWPSLQAHEVGCEGTPSFVVQLLLLHYLVSADGIAPRGQWVSFRDVPDGRLYYPAFRGGSELRLLQRFGHDPTAFEGAARALEGWALDLADHAYAFRVLPRLPMAVLLWEGDDEFPPELHILLDATAGNYLPTEDLAVIARYMTACLLRVAGAPAGVV